MSEFVLTFDNGPDPSVTPAVLESLAAHGHRAIFLPVGRNLESREGQDCLSRVAAAGHVIGNHTYSHPSPFGSAGASVVDEITRTQDLLGDHASAEHFFRPSAGGGHLVPGVLNRAAVDHLCAHRYTLLLWHVVCEDWRRPDGSWIDIALEQLRPDEATVLVLHDIACGGMAHFDRFLETLAQADVDVVTAPPASATPIIDGELIGSIDHLLAA